MRCTCTAIIHLRGPTAPETRHDLPPLLQRVRGVGEVGYSHADSLITVSFDDGLVSVGEMVRTIEDTGALVSGIAQRAS